MLNSAHPPPTPPRSSLLPSLPNQKPTAEEIAHKKKMAADSKAAKAAAAKYAKKK